MSKELQVKVYYTIRGSITTRMAAFSVSDTSDRDGTIMPVSLRKCLWTICSSSPDIICQEHDLSVYTANFRETCSSLTNQKKSPLVWEGHGLLSWILEAKNNQDVKVQGKIAATDKVEIYLELQPTLKWAKDKFYSALKEQNFDCFKSTPSSSPPQTQSCSCGINAVLQQQQRSASAWNTSSHDIITSQAAAEEQESSSPFQSTQKHHRQLLPPPSSIGAAGAATTQICRPEPLLPRPTLDTSDYRYRVSPPPPPASFRSIQYHQGHEESDRLGRRRRMTDGYSYSDPRGDYAYQHSTYYYDQYSRYDVAAATTTTERRSAFTPTRTAGAFKSIDDHSAAAAISSSEAPTPQQHQSSYIPVIYTPSLKKRKKAATASAAADIKRPALPAASQTSAAVRSYYEVDRDEHGNYILPVEIDSWTVVNLGTVVYDRPHYHNQRYIYPVNYTVRKWYRSMVDPKSDTQYTCRILDNGIEPKFEVTADDCPVTYSGPTPTTVWTIVVRRAFAIRNQEYGHNPVGPDFFGLRKNTIAKMIQDLPNADKCTQYIWQNFEPARFNKPGRNRRRTDPMLPSSLFGGVNYGLTSSRYMTHAYLQNIHHHGNNSALGSNGSGGGTLKHEQGQQQQQRKQNDYCHQSDTSSSVVSDPSSSTSPSLPLLPSPSVIMSGMHSPPTSARMSPPAPTAAASHKTKLPAAPSTPPPPPPSNAPTAAAAAAAATTVMNTA